LKISDYRHSQAFDAFDEGIAEGIDFAVVQAEILLHTVPESMMEES